MPEFLMIPSRATRATYPLHLRIVCALVARLADLQVSLQHAHTARLVRDFPTRYPAISTLADSVKFQPEPLPRRAQSSQGYPGNSPAFVVQQDPGHDPIYAPASKEEEDFIKMRAEVAQLLEDALSTKDLSGKNKAN